jgi:hypothetical protein
MTFLTLTLVALAAATSPPDCSQPTAVRGERRVFTNADLERIAACRPPASVEPEQESARGGRTGRARTERRSAGPERPKTETAEADWRARWRSVDQRARELRRKARELRLEAEALPRDPKKRPAGRKSEALLINRAQVLETEARELEDEFHAQARREGALPGWLRPR